MFNQRIEQVEDVKAIKGQGVGIEFNNAVGGSAAVAITETSGATVFDCGLSNVFTISPVVDVDDFTVTNVQAVQTIKFIVTQDATGGREMAGTTGSANFKGTYVGGAGTTIDVVTYTTTDGGLNWYLDSINTGTTA